MNPDGTLVIKPILQPADLTLEGSGTPTLPTGATLLLAQEKATLATIGVQASNFIDDGEPKTLMEALEAILLPLGQRMIQRGGTVYVYDINGLVEAARDGETPAIWWSADSQTLATSKVASSIKVTYDPNDDGTLMDGDKAMEFCPETHPWDVDQQGTTPDSDGHFYITFQSHLPSEDSHDGTDNHFTVHVGDAKGVTSWLNKSAEGKACMCFKIVPQMGGSEAVGVVGLIDVKSTDSNTPSGYRLNQVVGGNHVVPHGYSGYDYAAHYGGITNARGTEYVNVTIGGVTRQSLTLQPILRTKRVYVPGGGGYGADYCAYLLRLKQEILFDPRFNPFTQAEDEYNHKDAYDAMQGGLAYLFIPAEVRLYDAEEGGNVIAQYSNRKSAQTYLNPVNDYNGGDISLGWKMGEWIEPEEPSGNVTTVHTWLAYYAHSGEAVDSRHETTGVFGWKVNRHQIGPTNGKLMADMTNMPDGEYMPIPPKGGWIEVTIYDGAFGYVVPKNNSAHTIELGVNYDSGSDSIAVGAEVHAITQYQSFRWMLYKHPTIEVADPSPRRDVVDSDEIETKETVIETAKEPVEIDTTCGTMKNASPSSRGQLYRVPGVAVNVTNGNDSYTYHLPKAIYNLIRCGETATPERLLIRTLRQQYGTRRTMLSGEAAMDGGGLMLYAEDNQSNRSFILTGETQDVIADVSDCEFCEVVGDDGESAWHGDVTTHTVTTSLTNVTSNAPASVQDGGSLTVTLAPASGMSIDTVTVLMGGTDITATAYSNGVVTIASVTGDVSITASAVSVSPYDAQVEYLRGDGTAYIDTGIYGTPDLRTELMFQLKATSASKALFGSYSNASGYYLYLSAGTPRWQTGFGSHDNSSQAADTSQHTIVYNDYKVELDGTQLAEYSTAFTTTPHTLLLFNMAKTDGTLYNGISMDIMSCKLIKNGVTVRDFIPVRKDGIGYMYDKVSGELFGNENSSGAFTYGNDITT